MSFFRVKCMIQVNKGSIITRWLDASSLEQVRLAALAVWRQHMYILLRFTSGGNSGTCLFSAPQFLYQIRSKLRPWWHLHDLATSPVSFSQHVQTLRLQKTINSHGQRLRPDNQGCCFAVCWESKRSGGSFTVWDGQQEISGFLSDISSRKIKRVFTQARASKILLT